MDISKYVTNKDIQLSNDDINIEKLEKDIRKGYVLSDEVDKARSEALKENTASYTELEEKYNKLEKSYNDIETRNTELTNSTRGLKLQVEMVSQGFKKENLEEISALRNSLFKDEEEHDGRHNDDTGCYCDHRHQKNPPISATETTVSSRVVRFFTFTLPAAGE